MGISPEELIIGTKIEDGQPSFSSFPNKQAVLQSLLTFECDSNQVRTPLPWTPNPPPPSYPHVNVRFACVFAFFNINPKPFSFPGSCKKLLFSQQNAESAWGCDGRADNSFLQLLWKRRRQIQTQQGRVEAAPQQRAHRLPHGTVDLVIMMSSGYCI